jgi:hypothetical protein
MGYIIGLVLLLIVVPLLFVLLSRRTASTGRLGRASHDRGVTVSQPSSDQPTPRNEQTERRLPPG